MRYILVFVFIQVLLNKGVISESNADNDESSGSEDSESGTGSGGGDISKRNRIEGSVNTAQIRSTDVTYPDIINITVKAVIEEPPNPKEIKALLFKYYFTDQKEMSIWPKAIEETEKTLSLEFNERELFEMENDVKSIYRRILECDLILNKGKKKKNKAMKKHAKCYITLREYIDDGFTDFGFPRQTIEGQAHILEMNVAFNLMSLLILRMTQQVATTAHVSPLEVAKATLDIGERLVKSVKEATKNTIDARIQAISQIEICLMQEVLWQEFQVSCEFRMKRDVDTAAGIGGSADKFKQIYRAKVIDGVTKKEVCNIAMNTAPDKNKEQVKAELTKECAKLRDNYARGIKKEIKEFYTERTLPVVEEIPSLWSKSKEKLKELKTKLDHKLLI